ncbi:hypothetical protein [Candidatus Nitrosocosmicus sp. FF01]|uniref:hypothetical protein n=1 Tax=Candidatus Nitrosocosmicus sp. FF01 TaxID=3397670 RepID=UPI0039E97DF0
MIIYDDLLTLREFYSYYIKIQIEEKKEIVLINPFYETTDSVRETLSSGHKAIDVTKYEGKEKKLVISDSLKKYLGYKEEAGEEKIAGQIDESKQNRRLNIKTTNKEKVGTSHWWDDNKQMIEHADKMGNVGLSILADAGAFHFMRKTTELLEYECSLPKQFDLNLKAFCLYHQKDFDRLSEEQKQELVNHHGKVIKIEAH